MSLLFDFWQNFNVKQEYPVLSQDIYFIETSDGTILKTHLKGHRFAYLFSHYAQAQSYLKQLDIELLTIQDAPLVELLVCLKKQQFSHLIINPTGILIKSQPYPLETLYQEALSYLSGTLPGTFL
jgi:hypothetical protein